LVTAMSLTPLCTKSTISYSDIFANSKPYSKRLQLVYQEPRESCLMKKGLKLVSGSLKNIVFTKQYRILRFTSKKFTSCRNLCNNIFLLRKRHSIRKCKSKFEILKGQCHEIKVEKRPWSSKLDLN
jgi:hypothetical protein